MSSKARLAIALSVLLVALLAAYANHFGNGFHFDDSHTIVDNPAIRRLANLPSFFRDARSFSIYPEGQSYRPLVTTSLAIDYALAGGLRPFWFHLSTFLWFVVQLILMYVLYMYVLERASPHPQNVWVAGFAVALYGLHPASAETINYIIQRGDLYVALGIVAGVVIYAGRPQWHRYGLYLLPALAAMLAKPTGLIFAPILLSYIVLVDRARPSAARNAFCLSAVVLWLEKVMTPPTFFHTSLSSFDYWITQPYVTLRYFRSFFLPLDLNVDSDLRAFHSLWNGPAVAGFAFCALLIAVAVFTARRREWLPISFGLWWFLIALIPTAVYPLNEVENDHRMFLPFIGLSLAVASTAVRLSRIRAGAWARPLVVAGGIVLVACAWATHNRNEVWRTDESLWRDDIAKSPNNARGHVSLALALSDTGRLSEAMPHYETALRIDPNNFDAHNNLGIALAKLPGRLPDALAEYQTALRIKPDDWQAHFNLGLALTKIPGRRLEAIGQYEAALRVRPDFPDANCNLGIALADIPGRLPEAIAHYEAALRDKPDFPEAHCNLGMALTRTPGRSTDAIAELAACLQANPNDASAHKMRGLALSRHPGDMAEAVEEFQAALRVNPDDPDAHKMLGAVLSDFPDRLPEAVQQFEAALRTKPDDPDTHNMLGIVLAKVSGRLPEAIAQFEAALRLSPSFRKRTMN